ncbi:MAG: hypothetical protein H6917_14960 [Novosphingobium sp.]|nr:hypothetical protein [Novosphingobium sp.]MCP5403668.1 hypothetical protein [Novosphingobium sp.]
MAKYVMVVPTVPVAGQDADYNSWYDDVHVGEVCSVPGINSCRRFDAEPGASPNEPPSPYLAIYEIETDDIDGVVAELSRRAGAGEMNMSPALDLDQARMWVYRQR